MSALIEFQSVCKYYQMGDTTVKAADHISFQIQKGEFVAIVGQSGSGKSTCMNIIGCLDVPTSGAYLLDGQDVGQMNRNQLAGDPAVILADEPTGALDSHTGREVLEMLKKLHDAGNTVVLITHDNSIAVQAQRIIRLEDGHVIYDGDAHDPKAVVSPNLTGEGA